MVGQVIGVGPTATATGDVLQVQIPQIPDHPPEVLIAALHCQNTAQTADASADGWVRVGPAFIPNDPGTRLTALYVKEYVPDEPDPLFIFSGGGRLVGAIIAMTGIDPIAIDWSPYSVRAVSGNSLEMPGYDGTDFVLEIWAANFGSGQSYGFTAGPDMTLSVVGHNPPGTEDVNVSRSALAVWSNTGPFPQHTIQTQGNSSQASGYSVAFQTAAQGMPIKYSDGAQLVDARLMVSDGAVLKTPTRLARFGPGFPSVTDMLATDGFTIAHRGGSRVWPEMSRFAYIQSTLRGYKALEVSVARTSDGRWFGAHDEYLDRVVFGVDGTTLLASEMTWAEVQTHQVLGSICEDNPGTPPRPFQPVEQILSDFAATSVIFIDPKFALAYADELLDIMDAQPGATDRIVGKYFGMQGGIPEDSTSWALKCRQRGYKTWGYFYEGSNFAYADRWDIVGMDYSAPQSAWDGLAAAAPGKPIIGHICVTPENATDAMSKGAVGVMVSGVTRIYPT